MNISKRDTKIGSIGLSCFIFKSLASSDITQLIGAIAEYTNDHKSVIINTTVWADSSLKKNWFKTFDELFDEANSPVFWIDRPNNKTELTGSIIVMSGTTVKTLVSDKFITKTFDTAFGRMLFGGNFETEKKSSIEKQTTILRDNLLEALKYSGMDIQNLLQIKINIPYPINYHSFQTMFEEKEPVIPMIKISSQSPLDLNIIALQASPDTQFFQSTDHFPEGTLSIRCIQKNNLKCILLHFETTAEKNELPDVFKKIEEKTVNLQLDWNQLFIGYIYGCQPESVKVIKEKMKENSIPASSLVIIQSDGMDIKNKTDFQIVFIHEN